MGNHDLQVQSTTTSSYYHITTACQNKITSPRNHIYCDHKSTLIRATPFNYTTPNHNPAMAPPPSSPPSATQMGRTRLHAALLRARAGGDPCIALWIWLPGYSLARLVGGLGADVRFAIFLPSYISHLCPSIFTPLAVKFDLLMEVTGGKGSLSA